MTTKWSEQNPLVAECDHVIIKDAFVLYGFWIINSKACPYNKNVKQNPIGAGKRS